MKVSRAKLAVFLGLTIATSMVRAENVNCPTCGAAAARDGTAVNSTEQLTAAIRRMANHVNPSDPYDRIFPYYAQSCAVSQIVGKDGDKGGSAGHATIYLKGVCRDLSFPYPRLKMCPEGSKDLSDPNSGTVVSVDKMFSNVNWVAVEGKEMMLDGGARRRGEAVTAATRDRVVREVVESGAFRGVRVHGNNLNDFDPEKMSYAEHVARKSLSTDYAMNFGRNAYCPKVPMNRGLIEEMVAYLNGKNAEYYDGFSRGHRYRWSGFRDNCTHIVNNAFAAAGFRDFKKTNVNWFRQLWNMALPGKEVLREVRQANREPEPDVARVFNNQQERTLFNRHGALGAKAAGSSTSSR